ncbi:general secretion pathway protein GspK [Thalassotalea sediminis]|uniref:general secretion pathway protein GspK n=1 Tax=Thalassotalea sediminis TaxID=1759089 RepID=UPI002573D113|nr:type II secretion system protein GspK [Thalassotalea sediminis]
MNNTKGIALVQVLIITMIITTLALFITQSIRQQVKLTVDVQVASELELQIENAQSELFIALLSEKAIRKETKNPLTSKWNFHNKSFHINDNVEARIQGMNGLLSINMLDKTLTNRLLISLGYKEGAIREFIDSLKDWIDEDDLNRLNGAERHFYQQVGKIGPRNGPIQSMHELELIRNGEYFDQSVWSKYFSLSYVRGFNPMLAPEKLLRAFLNNDDKADAIIRLRDINELTFLEFFKLTGIEGDENIVFATGNKFRVELRAYEDGRQVTKAFVVEINPLDVYKPITVKNIVWNKV